MISSDLSVNQLYTVTIFTDCYTYVYHSVPLKKARSLFRELLDQSSSVLKMEVSWDGQSRSKTFYPTSSIEF